MAGLRVGEQRGAGEETLERVDLLEDLDITMVTRFESSERLATVEDMSRPLRNDRSANRMREGDTLTSRKTVFILSPNAFHRLSSSNVQWNSFDFSSSVQCFAPPPGPSSPSSFIASASPSNGICPMLVRCFRFFAGGPSSSEPPVAGWRLEATSGVEAVVDCDVDASMVDS